LVWNARCGAGVEVLSFPLPASLRRRLAIASSVRAICSPALRSPRRCSPPVSFRQRQAVDQIIVDTQTIPLGDSRSYSNSSKLTTTIEVVITNSSLAKANNNAGANIGPAA
jgi:hypothetical protein